MKAYVKKIAYYLPKTVEDNPKNRLTKKTGIYRRHICAKDEIASDLAYKAAERLFADGVDKNKIEYLLYCTQSPDYFLPTTACRIQDRLGLNKQCGALDYNLGCSGYVYGLSLAKGLIESGQVKNVLLITAETYSKYINPQDNSVKPLFGDAATATFIEGVDTDSPGIDGLVFGTDGRGFKDLIVPAGGMKNPYARTEEKVTCDQYGNIRTNYNLYMNGAAIGDFAMEVVPQTVNTVLERVHLQRSDIDYFVFHQANKFILDYLKQKCGLEDFPYWNNMVECGNTVSCSIPIALNNILQKKGFNFNRVLIVGFGVGLSWGGCVVNCSFCGE